MSPASPLSSPGKPKLTCASPLDRTDQELAINIKKATNSDEISPKRKHVRACIIYTWDHKSSQAFWAGIKVCVQPAPTSRQYRPKS